MTLIERQYDRLLADVTHVFNEEKSNAIKSLDDAKLVFHNNTTKYLNTNSDKVSMLYGCCERCKTCSSINAYSLNISSEHLVKWYILADR